MFCLPNANLSNLNIDTIMVYAEWAPISFPLKVHYIRVNTVRKRSSGVTQGMKQIFNK